MKKIASLLLAGLTAASALAAQPVDYVSTLVGTQSEFALSTGNTYPAVAMPWGMNFWTPQTGKMGDGWAYTYDAKKIRGFKQTQQARSLMRSNAPAGSATRPKKPLLITIKYILPSMTW